MKAVIVECSNSAAIALCDDGSFKRLPNQGYSIGQELYIKQKVSKSRTIRRLSICASLALFLSAFVGIGSYSYVQPYSYVSLDINPSIEYALNRYDKVIQVAGINDDGKQVVSSIESDVTNQSITSALSTTLEQLEKENYISKETDNHVIISVCSNNGSKAESIASKVNTLSEETSELCSINTVTVTKDVKDDADSLGITPGKLALIQAVAETSPEEDFDISEWTDKSVVELETTIQQANAASTDPKNPDANETVIDSEFLSSVLDDHTMHSTTDSSVTASQGAHKNNSSITDDKQNVTTKHNTTTPGSTDTTGLDSEASSQKPEVDASTTQPDPSTEPGHESESSVKPEDTGTTSKPDASESKPSDSNTDHESEQPISDEASSSKADASTVSDDTTSKPTEGTSSASSSKNSSSETMNSSSSSSKNSSIKDNNSSRAGLTEETAEISTGASTKRSSYSSEQVLSDTPEDISNISEIENPSISTEEEDIKVTDIEVTDISETDF